MDYKAMWKELQAMSLEINQGHAILNGAKDQPEVKAIADDANAAYTEQVKAYEEAVKAQKEAQNNTALVRCPGSVSQSAVSRKVEKPLPPNKLEAYTPTIFGLDKAQHDCRFEMIKIVREVDAVAEDPQVAVDPTRNNQFLSPVVFRQLIPYARRVDPIAMEKEIAELKDKLQAELANVEILQGQREALTVQLAETQNKLRATAEERDGLKTQLQSAESRIETLGAGLANSETLVQTITEDSDRKISDLESSKSDLASQLKEAETNLLSRDRTIETLNTEIQVLGDGDKEVTRLSDLLGVKDAELHDLHTRLDQEAASRLSAEQMVQERTSELMGVRNQLSGLEMQNRELTSKFNIQGNDLSEANQSILLLNQQANSLSAKLYPQWDGRNNLDQGFHGRTVAFVNLTSMDGGFGGLALDMGDKNGTRVHGWSFATDNDNQKLRLEKVNPDSRTSDWRIKCRDKYLYCSTDGSTLQCDAALDAQIGCAEWWIRKIESSRGYIIENRIYQCLDVSSPQTRQNGSSLRSSSKNEGSPNQTWAIFGL